jgi:hypothetical protein
MIKSPGSARVYIFIGAPPAVLPEGRLSHKSSPKQMIGGGEVFCVTGIQGKEIFFCILEYTVTISCVYLCIDDIYSS